MKIGVFTRKSSLESDSRLVCLMETLSAAGNQLYRVGPQGLDAGTDMLMAVGGDGTFLSAAAVVGDSGVPVLGVNAGRLGFLSENVPEMVAEALAQGAYSIEKRTLLTAEGTGFQWPYALNEVRVCRYGAAMLGIDVTVDGMSLPTYWADGLIVATSSGSTAYSLSVGGPIALPESKVLILSPVAPHNLNVRPLVVPDNSRIELRFRARDGKVEVAMDNRTAELSSDAVLEVRMAQFSLNRVRLKNTDFIKALTSKLFWGEDIRNGNE